MLVKLVPVLVYQGRAGLTDVCGWILFRNTHNASIEIPEYSVTRLAGEKEPAENKRAD